LGEADRELSLDLDLARELEHVKIFFLILGVLFLILTSVWFFIYRGFGVTLIQFFTNFFSGAWGFTPTGGGDDA
jgi:hypothetical protein